MEPYSRSGLGGVGWGCSEPRSEVRPHPAATSKQVCKSAQPVCFGFRSKRSPGSLL